MQISGIQILIAYLKLVYLQKNFNIRMSRKKNKRRTL